MVPDDTEFAVSELIFPAPVLEFAAFIAVDAVLMFVVPTLPVLPEPVSPRRVSANLAASALRKYTT